MNAATIKCQTSSRSSNKSMPIARETSAIPKFATRINDRLSSRSATDPARKPTSRLGDERTAYITPTIALESVMLNTNQLRSTCCIP